MAETSDDKKPGPKPRRVKSDESFEELTRRVLRTPKPKEGWPESGEGDGSGDDAPTEQPEDDAS